VIETLILGTKKKRPRLQNEDCVVVCPRPHSWGYIRVLAGEIGTVHRWDDQRYWLVAIRGRGSPLALRRDEIELLPI
jgi:hypothetical protein